MTNETDKKIEESKKRIKEKRRDFLRITSAVAAITLGAATIAAPKIAVNNKIKDIKEEQKELIDLNSQETEHESVRFECHSKNAADLLKQNGYSLNIPSGQKDFHFRCDVLDANNNSVGLADVISEEKTFILDLIVLKDSSLMDLISQQPESDFKPQKEGTISFRQGERIAEAVNRHIKLDILKAKEQRAKEMISKTRTVYMGTN